MAKTLSAAAVADDFQPQALIYSLRCVIFTVSQHLCVDVHVINRVTSVAYMQHSTRPEVC